MRMLLAVVTIVFAASCSHASMHQSVRSIVGLWQFPERGVWVQINADGSTFQCRIAPGGTVFKAEGRFTAGRSILWSDIWEIDQVVAKENSITLRGEWGDFTYLRAISPMSSACTTSEEA